MNPDPAADSDWAEPKASLTPIDKNQLSDELENFDSLFTGEPASIESQLSKLLPVAEAQGKQSVQAQILSLIGLAQAMQNKIEEAHQTLDRAVELTPPGDLFTASRVTLERGRLYHQAGEPARAMPYFQQAYELARAGEVDFQAINAAHMIAIVSESPADKIAWNAIALELANSSEDSKARAWLGPIYNNLARSQVEAGDYEDALLSYLACQTIAEQRDEHLIVRGAIWGRALALRELGQPKSALNLQLDLLQQYQGVAERGEMPAPLLAVGRGLVHAELAELYSRLISEVPETLNQLRNHAQLALADLQANEWIQRLEPERLRRLQHWTNASTLDQRVS